MKLHNYACISAITVNFANADWQFRSRPDLAPPRLNITIPATSSVSPEYLFVAPFAGLTTGSGEPHGPLQAAPYIFRSNGDLVWSGYSYFSIWATNFQAARWLGQDVLVSFEGDHNAAYGHGHGHVTILNQHYETVRELRAGKHKMIDKHEFHVVDGKTALVQIYQPVPRNLEEWAEKPEQQWIVDAVFQELDIATGELLFEWSSLEHVSPAESVLSINGGHAGSGFNSSDAWDYFHINSVDKDATGSYLISARDACAVHKINGTTGAIIWRLGGKNSSFHLGPGVRFCFQHHARWISTDSDGEIISLYDNSAHGSESDGGKEVHTAPTSSGKIIKLDTKTWSAILVQGFYPPDDLLSKSQGSTQILPNGNALVNWGSEGAVTEFLSNGTPIFHAYMDSDVLGRGVQNYRAFRFNWTGVPNEAPALVFLKSRNGDATAYVSWNGDTETAVWRFYQGDGKTEARKTLGETARTSFETSFKVGRGDVQSVVAEAVDSRGRVIRVSGVAEVEPEVLPASAASRKVSHAKQGSQQTAMAGYAASWRNSLDQEWFA